MMAEEGKIRVERFNNVNFEFWKIQIVDYLYQKDLYLSLSGKAQKSNEMTRQRVGGSRSESPRGQSNYP